MGQAKLRGSFEKRRAEAEETSALKLQKEKEEEITYWNSLSEEEKKAIKERKAKVKQLITFALGLTQSSNPLKRRLTQQGINQLIKKRNLAHRIDEKVK